MDKTCAVKECVTIRQRTKGLGKYKTHEISKTKHVAISENSNWAVLRIAKRLLGLQGFPIRKDSYYQDKYKHTSIWQQMTEGFSSRSFPVVLWVKLTQFIWKEARPAGNNHLMIHTKRGSNLQPERWMHCTTLIDDKYTETTPLLQNLVFYFPVWAIKRD